MMIDGEGDEGGNDDGGFEIGDDFFDLSFGDEEPADLSTADMAEGTELETAVVTDLSGAPTPPVPVTEAKPVTPTETPAAPAPAAAATPATETPSPEQPGATETPPPTVNIEEFVAANADAIIGNLASSHFKIDPKQAEELGFTPEISAWIERRDAKNFLLTMVQMNNALQKTLPHVVANLMDVTHRVKESHNEFFGGNKDLADPKYVPHLKTLAVTLRQLNPQMDKPTFIKTLAQKARVMFGLPEPQATPANGAARPGVRRGRPTPFAPVGSVAPQRPAGGGQLAGLDLINSQLRLGADD